jgi:hypothetical protein
MDKPNLDELKEKLTSWAQDAVTRLGATHIHVLGSLVYKNGEQFGASSDIDLVMVMPELTDASERTRWLESFSEHKQLLEGALVRALRRSAQEPIVSVAAVTKAEIAMDIHKDGHREFFSKNSFRDLISGTEHTGLPGAGTQTPSRFVHAAVAFTQKIRNEFFATSFNTTAKLLAYGGEDPLPKRFMRTAAMAARAQDNNLEPGAEHDVRAGLDRLFLELTLLRRQHHPAYLQLQDLVSVRRGARGAGGAVKPSDQLLLAELIYDIALAQSVPIANPQPQTGGKLPPPPQVAGLDGTALDTEAGVKPVGDAAKVEPLPVADGEDERLSDVAMVMPQTSNRAVGYPKIPHGSSTAFFNDRFCVAFSGDRKITWYEDGAEIAMRLGALLKLPLVFADGIPIWWWRGGNLQIETFERLENGTYLMNVNELAIRRIASVSGKSYERSFVYIETDAMELTGLYKYDPEEVSTRVKEVGYDYEEYGLFMGRHRITRSQFDDGSAVIAGNLVDTRGKSRLRVRYITPYNFLIAPIGSPINNIMFDQQLEAILNEALTGDREAAIERLRKAVRRLPLREGRE